MSPSVLIVGAGPTGLTLALALLKNGVPVRIIDKLASPRAGQKGNGIQPRTLEILKILGLLDDVLHRSTEIRPLRMYEMPGATKVEKEHALVKIVAPTPDKPLPNARGLGQDRFEEILFEHLGALGCEVERGTELRSCTENADRVSAEILKADGTVDKAEFEFVVGSDGGHSTVRHMLGLSFLGETREAEGLVVADMYVPKGLDHEFWHIFRGASLLGTGSTPGAQTAAGSDHVHFMFRSSEIPQLFTVIAGGPRTREFPVETRDGIIDYFYKATGRRDVVFGEMKCVSWWRPNIRMVDKFGEGRTFVAGDAAHTHSPTGGQGMNSGIQDAFNLAWKISLVYKKLAPFSLLSTYSSERLPVIAAMLEKTTLLLNETLKKETAAAGAAWNRGDELQMFGINYRGSAIVLDEGNTQPDVLSSAYSVGKVLRAGDRAPAAPVKCASDATVQTLLDVFSCQRHTVLVFTSDESAARAVIDATMALPEGVAETSVVLPRESAFQLSDAKVLEAIDRHAQTIYQVEDEPTVVVVRPDGAIGAIVLEAGGVGRYFSKILQ
ncbi:FAD binding domain-containing protein [Schizophyllum amplum]|uniref:FAD binding domain-containing protein n=1 Tax=Schizophyllum amplum TaxID=97359 RepID=A0A550CBR2_9AGAR|nr:FAD binding domain-containing protein [Auriculariopsis ampla]